MSTSEINTKIQHQKNQLLQHSLYGKIKTIDDLNCFLEFHVYAVWDFMSALKVMQQKLTSERPIIDMSKLATGIYILKIGTGKERKILKLVKI